MRSSELHAVMQRALATTSARPAASVLVPSALVWTALLVFPLATAAAQHAHATSPADTTRARQDSMMMNMPGIAHMSDVMRDPLGIPMARFASGTSRLPEASPMHAYMFSAGPWELMANGSRGREPPSAATLALPADERFDVGSVVLGTRARSRRSAARRWRSARADRSISSRRRSNRRTARVRRRG